MALAVPNGLWGRGAFIGILIKERGLYPPVSG
jgi:hypothetical protein